MKRIIKRVTGLLLAFTVVFTSANIVSATENASETTTEATSEATTEATTEAASEQGQEENDKVEISKDDKPYLALGEDLSKDQRKKVLKYMGISEKDLDKYEVVYVNNEEEHKYLDEYISSSAIGTHSLSSVVITQAEKGQGLKLSVYNVNYCTVGMYKNACATAGIKDANIIVAAPFPISGTAALVGILKAYEEMSGKEIDEEIVDAAMDELVTTGELNESIDGDSEKVEAFIADLKEQLGKTNWDSDEDILSAIDKTAEKYELKLSKEDKEKVLALINKLKNLDLDWESIESQAADLAEKLKELDIDTEGFWDAICNFFRKLLEAILSLFK